MDQPLIALVAVAQGPDSMSGPLYGGSQLTITPIPGDLMLFSDLRGHQVYTWSTCLSLQGHSYTEITESEKETIVGTMMKRGSSLQGVGGRVQWATVAESTN